MLLSLPRPASAFTLIALASLLGLGCQHGGQSGSSEDSGSKQPKMCTQMACFNQAVVATKLSAAGAPLGAHAFAIDVDGEARTCTVEFTNASESTHASCSDGLSLSLGPAMQGREIAGDGVVGYTEDPIPGQFRWELTIEGQPAKVHVVHTVGGQTIVDESADFVYTEHRPNGAGCEPVCQTAELEWTGP